MTATPAGNIAVLGAGAWGTAFALHLTRADHQRRVVLWARDARQAALMTKNRVNAQYLPDISLPDTLTITSDVALAVASADLIIAATPIAAMPQLITDITPHVSPPPSRKVQGVRGAAKSPPPFFWLSKGFLTDADKVFLPHQYVSAHWQSASGVISGPSFAQEVAKGLPTALVVASHDLSAASHCAQKIRSATLRAYPNTDLIGVELGGAMKNVLAIAAGICDGLALGQNARASLITRGLVEMTRLAEAMGGELPSAVMGLAGLGDLILTCTGNLSRNRRVGLMLAEGMALPDILTKLGHVAEGVAAAKAATHLAAHYDVEAPITAAVAKILAGDLPPKAAAEMLLARAPKMGG